MNAPEHFNELVEALLSDKSPARRARCLDLTEQRMLVVAQRLRGCRTVGPAPGFLETLRGAVVAADEFRSDFRSNGSQEIN
ncbi:MAG TPA: hypothetical protein DEV93_21100 [Chloroflexi bacterium]|jgi:hypothetical protein|nr:hypothetical protein [Chloroflexota bacterium]